MASPDKKAFLLRLPPEVWAQLERLAAAELRSVNGQIEFLLREALARRMAPPSGTPDQGAGSGGSAGSLAPGSGRLAPSTRTLPANTPSASSTTSRPASTPRRPQRRK